MSTGDTVELGIDSWAGRSWHPVRIVQLTPRRAYVIWLGPPALRWQTGETYLVPQSALREVLTPHYQVAS